MTENNRGQVPFDLVYDPEADGGDNFVDEEIAYALLAKNPGATCKGGECWTGHVDFAIHAIESGKCRTLESQTNTSWDGDYSCEDQWRDKGALRLAEALRLGGGAILEGIHLQDCALGDEGALALLKVIEAGACPLLLRLDLYGDHEYLGKFPREPGVDPMSTVNPTISDAVAARLDGIGDWLDKNSSPEIIEMRRVARAQYELGYACEYEDLTDVKRAIEDGADPNKVEYTWRGKRILTALDVAEKNEHERPVESQDEVAAYLRSIGGKRASDLSLVE